MKTKIDMRVTILLSIGVAIAAADPIGRHAPERIVGGSVTTINHYPFGAALLFSPNLVIFTQHCGGSILTQRAILSAAHCFDGTRANQWRIRVGSSFANSGGSVHSAALHTPHPNFNWRTADNDIAILRSATTIAYIFTTVQPASIASANYHLADNQAVWAIGWGRTSFAGPLSEQLRHVQIWTVNQAVCRQRYAGMGVAITDNMVCAGWLDVGGRDLCSNDYGGPLLHNGVVIGVISFGAGCGTAGHPGVYTRVSRYTAWILSNV